MDIYRSATFVGAIIYGNGNRTHIYLGHNSVTGEIIVWQKFKGKIRRHTGRNITLFADELTSVLNTGEAVWDKNAPGWSDKPGSVSQGCLKIIMQHQSAYKRKEKS